MTHAPSLKRFHLTLRSLWWSVFPVLLRHLKTTFLVGSRGIWFSGSSCMAPVSGFYGGSAVSWYAYIIRVAILMMNHPSKGLLSCLVYHIPSLCASLYVSYCVFEKNRFMRYLFGIVVPLSCMVAFVNDSVGNGAWWYSLYWLIPVAITLVMQRHSSRFGIFLASSFIAHAVGSVCWMATHDMTVVQWQMLVGCVWYERLMQTMMLIAVTYVWDYGVAVVASWRAVLRRGWTIA